MTDPKQTQGQKAQGPAAPPPAPPKAEEPKQDAPAAQPPAAEAQDLSQNPLEAIASALGAINKKLESHDKAIITILETQQDIVANSAGGGDKPKGKFGQHRERSPQTDTKTGVTYPSKAAAAKAVCTEYGLDPNDKNANFFWYTITSKDPDRFRDATPEESAKALKALEEQQAKDQAERQAKLDAEAKAAEK